MNGLAIFRGLAETAFSGTGTETMTPTDPAAAIKWGWEQGGWPLGGAIAVCSVMFLIGRWAGPRIDTRLGKHNDLIDAAIAATHDSKRRSQKFEDSFELAVRCLEKISGKVDRNCAAHEPPASDTTLKKLVGRKPSDPKATE